MASRVVVIDTGRFDSWNGRHSLRPSRVAAAPSRRLARPAAVARGGAAAGVVTLRASAAWPRRGLRSDAKYRVALRLEPACNHGVPERGLSLFLANLQAPLYRLDRLPLRRIADRQQVDLVAKAHREQLSREVYWTVTHNKKTAR